MPCPPTGDLPNPGIEPRSNILQVNSLPSEPPGKPMNTGEGSLSVLQGIFPTQELNWGLLHCFLVAQTVKCLPAMQETWVQSLGWEDPLEEGMATYSSILAWGIPGTEEPGGIKSMGSQSQT